MFSAMAARLFGTPSKNRKKVEDDDDDHEPGSPNGNVAKASSPAAVRLTIPVEYGHRIAFSNGSIFSLDSGRRYKLRDANCVIELYQADDDEFQFQLVIHNSKELLVSDDLKSLEGQMAYAADTIEILAHDVQGSEVAVRFQFADVENGNMFKMMLGAKMYEALHQISFARAMKDNAMLADTIINENDAQDDDYDPMEVEQTHVNQWDDDERNAGQNRSQQANRETVLLTNHPLSFVARGDAIGVFRNVDIDGATDMQYTHKIKDITNSQGVAVVPSKMLPMFNETKLAVTNANDSETINIIDVEYGKVTAEIRQDQNGVPVTFDSIIGASKLAQRGHAPELMASNHKQLFTVDTRAGEVVQFGTVLQNKATLTAVCTTSDGQVAVADSAGDIRLRDDITKSRAKALIPGIGDEIKGLDVSQDGKWLLATCTKYLIVIPTFGKANEEQSMFCQSLKLEERHAPIKLQLLPADVLQYRMGAIDFTAAKFNAGERNSDERIVTSTGRFIINWNFESVKKQRRVLTDYTITEQSDSIVSADYRFDQASNVVATMPDDVVSLYCKSKARQ